MQNRLLPDGADGLSSFIREELMKARLTMKDAVKLTGLSRMAVRRYVDKGAFRCYRNPITKFRYFEERELKEDIEKLGIYSKYE